MSLRLTLFAAAGTLGFLALGAPGAALAQIASSSSEVVVTAQRLDQARDSIQPQVGASTYTLNSQALQALPGGENSQMNQVILQAPGAVQDSYGQLHIRGEHNGLQFRLDGVILPEGLSVFSQAISPRLAGSVELITGALPAEYGLRTAGIINITTKSGTQPGGEVSIYGGSHGDVEPSFEYGGGDGTTNFFVSGSYKQNGLGIEAPDTRSDPLHDRTEQFNGFAYADRIIDTSSRVSLILGASDQKFQIPDVTGQLNGGLGLNVNGSSAGWPADLARRAAALADLAGAPFDLNRLTAALIGRVLLAYDRFTDGEHLPTFADLWQRYDVLRNRRATVLEGARRHAGTVVGIDGEGALVLRDERGRTQRFRAGEVTLEKETTG